MLHSFGVIEVFIFLASLDFFNESGVNQKSKTGCTF